MDDIVKVMAELSDKNYARVNEGIDEKYHLDLGSFRIGFTSGFIEGRNSAKEDLLQKMD